MQQKHQKQEQLYTLSLTVRIPRQPG